MDFSLTTPALLFPAISLLFLVYTNRFIALASHICELYSRNQTTPQSYIAAQLQSLNYCTRLVRYMQFSGVASFFGCVLCMFLLFLDLQMPAKITFAVSLFLLLVSFALSLREVQASVDAPALQVHGLSALENLPLPPHTGGIPPG